jgi:hypothetical protein
LAAGEKTFEQLKARLDDPKEFAPIATKGLLLMMQGDEAAGADCYNIAIQRASDLGNHRVVLRATLNYLISSIDVTKTLDPKLLKICQLGIARYNDADCSGSALGLVRRLEKADLSGSDELSRSSTEFINAARHEVGRYRKSIVANLLEMSALKPS